METQQIEYKALWKDDYLKWICGFANAQGGILSVVGENHESDTNVTDNVTMNVVDNVVDKLSERQKDIIKILSDSVVDNVVENATSLSHRLGVSHRTIQRDLEHLKNSKLSAGLAPTEEATGKSFPNRFHEKPTPSPWEGEL